MFFSFFGSNDGYCITTSWLQVEPAIMSLVTVGLAVANLVVRDPPGSTRWVDRRGIKQGLVDWVDCNPLEGAGWSPSMTKGLLSLVIVPRCCWFLIDYHVLIVNHHEPPSCVFVFIVHHLFVIVDYWYCMILTNMVPSLLLVLIPLVIPWLVLRAYFPPVLGYCPPIGCLFSP